MNFFFVIKLLVLRDEIINLNQRPFIPKNIKVKKEVGDQNIFICLVNEKN